MKIIDTHTHDYFSSFDDDREEMFQRSREAGVVAKIQIGCDEVSSLAAVKLANENEDFFATIGVHPNDVKNIGKEVEYRSKGFEDYQPVAKNIAELETFFANLIEQDRSTPADRSTKSREIFGGGRKIVGIGECGFDFYHDKKEDFYDIQKEALTMQFRLAQKYDLPLVIHTREANEELMDFFATTPLTPLSGGNEREKFAGFSDFENKSPHLSVVALAKTEPPLSRGSSKLRGVIHCFSGTMEMAKLFTEKYGFYLGIGGIITYNKSTELREIVAEIPAKFLIVETDAPFLSPHQWRKKNSRNESTSLPEIIAKIAEVKGMGELEMAEILEKNSRDLFLLKK